MEVAYTQKAKEDIAYWKSTGNKQVMAKISTLVTLMLPICQTTDVRFLV
jgi:hypothetical protein